MADDQDLLSDYVNRPAVQSDTDFLLAQVKQVNDALDKLAAVKITLGNATGAGAAGAGATQAKAGIDALTAATDKLLLSYSSQAKQLAEVKIVQGQVNKANQDAAKDALGLVNAYDRLSDQYNKSARETQALVVQYGKYSDQAKASAADTQALYQRLVEADQAVGKFGRNVGNYPTVFKTFGETGKQALEKVNDGFKDMVRNIAASVVAFIGIRGLFEFGKESIESFEKIESEGKRLENSLKNLGASAKDVEVLKGSIIELSKAFPYLTAADLTQVQQKLVTYGKLTSEQIKELTPTILNFAANQRIGVGEATDVVTKALEGNSRGLKSYGINIKDAADTAGRFNLIQTELGDRVKGAGDVFAETGEGKIATYKARLTEIKQVIGAELLPVYAEFLSGSIGILNVIKQIDFGNVIKGIAALTAIWVTYRAVVLSVNIAKGFTIAAQVAERAATEGLTIAKAAETLAEETNGRVKNANTVLTYLMVGAQKAYAFVVKAATFEVQLFNTSIKVSPLGVFLTLLGIGVTLFTSFSANAANTSEGISKMKEKLEATNEIMKKSNETFASQREVIEGLVKKVEDHTAKLGDRKKALEDLIALDPNYLQGLTLENIETEKGTKIIDDYVNALQRKAFAEAAEEKLKDLGKEQLDVDADRLTAQQKLNESKKEQQRIESAQDKNAAPSIANVGIVVNHKVASNQLQDVINDLDNKEKEIKGRVDVIKELIADAGKSDAQFNQKSGLGRPDKEKPYDSTADDEAKKSAEELAKYLIELDDKLAKAKREHAAADLKAIADDAKEVADDNTRSLDKRLAAFDIYSEAQAAIVRSNTDSEIAQEQKKLERIAEIKKKDPRNLTDEEDKIRHTQELVTQTLINLEQKRDTELEKLAREHQKQLDAINKSNADKEIIERTAVYTRQKALDQAAYSDQLTRLTDEYNKKFIAAKGDTDKQTKLTNEFNRQKLELQDAFLVASLQKEIDFAKQELEIQKLNSIGNVADQEKIANAEQKLSDLKLKLKEAETKQIIDLNNDQIKSAKEIATEIAKALNEASKGYNELSGIADKALTSSIENQKRALQDQIDAVDANKQKQIDAINATTANAVEKQKKIDEVNAQSAAKTAQLQARQKQLDIEKAEFDKVVGIGKIILNTAIAVTKFLAEGNIPEAIAAGAEGAAELVIAVAAPIPKLKDGTRDSQAGPHWLGDGGKRELAIMPDGNMFVSAATDTLYDLPAHTVVHPDADALLATVFGMSMKPLNVPTGQVDNGMKKLIAQQEQSNKLLRDISKRPTAVVKNTWAGWSEGWTDGSRWWSYVNRNTGRNNARR